MKNAGLLIFILSILCSCNKNYQSKSIEELKQEIIEVEHDFCEMTANQGLAVSFPYFAADSAVIKRGENLIVGKQAIAKAYAKYMKDTNVSLVWKPDFVDVSASGDMAYTFGKYTYINTDLLGVKHQSTGIFHTVWKRQANGDWKYVFD